LRRPARRDRSLALQLVRAPPRLGGFGFLLGFTFVFAFGSIAHGYSPVVI